MTDAKWTRRDFLRRSAVATGVAAGAPALLTACGGGGGGNLLAQLRQQGSVTLGIANEAPFGYLNKQDQVTGESPAVAKAVFQNLGIPQVAAEVVDFGALISALKANRYPVIAAGMFITPERCDAAAFSIPDYTAREAFLVPPGNPKNVTRYEDVARQQDVTLGVLGGAVEGDFAKAAGVPASRITTFDSQSTLYQGVVTGRVYCGSLTHISLAYLAQTRKQGNLQVTEAFYPVVNGEKQIQAGGFVFRPENDQLRQAFNGELRKLHRNGKWVDIVSQFIGFSKANLPPRGLTTQELCSKGDASPTVQSS